MTSVCLFNLLRLSISVCSKPKYLQYYSVKRWSSHTHSPSHTQTHRGGKSKMWLYKLTIYLPSTRCIVQPCKSDIKHCLITLLCKVLFPPIMESHPSSFLPSPPLYCISQASPITVSIPRQATSGGPPSPLRTMAPWAPRRLSSCKASMPPQPATPLSSTWPARISIRAQVCTRLSFIQWLIWFMLFIHHPAIH